VASDASEATVVNDVGSRWNSEPTLINPPPRPEARVPGASLTLPANPLGELDAADLASFIDLGLLETNAGDVARPAPAARVEGRADRARRIVRHVAPYAACAAVMLSLGIALGGASKPASVAVAVVVRPPPAEAAAPSAELAPPDGEPTPAARNCVARVTTKPAGAAVFWGETALGSTPIRQAAVPCGTANVMLRREHFAEVVRTITAHRERDTIVAERLHRPPAKLIVTSSPPRAFIRLNKHRIGPTPREIDTPRFERVRIEASLPGYRRWRKTLYVKEAESEVAVTLVRAPAPVAQSLPAPRIRPTHAAPQSANAAGPVALR
jgi:hypothetical protein